MAFCVHALSHGNASDMTLPDGEEQIARDVKWTAIIDMQRAQAQLAELWLEKIREKVFREGPIADPASQSTVEPGGRMWISGHDTQEESPKLCREHPAIELARL
ncbi:hypothetical protein N7507_009266 [Penicillium longicatenatum]|nr:hypothetical protein N7507_009266 [Penicillium longicatenatum]